MRLLLSADTLLTKSVWFVKPKIFESSNDKLLLPGCTGCRGRTRRYASAGGVCSE